MHWTASSGALDITRLLLDRKAEVDKPDGSGWTPLHIAGWSFLLFPGRLLHSFKVSAGNFEVAQELIGAGADVNRFVPS